MGSLVEQLNLNSVVKLSKKTQDFELKIGNLILPNNIICAPLADWSDFAFRKILSQFHPGLMFCEMVKMEALYHNRKTLELLQFSEEMRPIGAQLIGNNLSIVADCAKIIEDLGFNLIDLNAGCPSPNMVDDDCGSSLLLKPELIGQLLAKMVQAVKIPVTVKIRTGWNEQKIVAPQIVKIAEEAGARAVFVHGRTKTQGLSGKVNVDIIKECKRVAKVIKIIGNGGICDVGSAENMLSQSNCDGILLASALLGKPWLIEEIKSYFLQKTWQGLSKEELFTLIMTHFELIKDHKNEKSALIDLRKWSALYLKGFAGAREVRKMIQNASISEILLWIQKYLS